MSIAATFQFLIGTLKTFWSKPTQLLCHLFQFLIGTLKTHVSNCYVHGIAISFNSS